MDNKEIAAELTGFIEKLAREKDSFDETIKEKIEALIGGYNPAIFETALQYNEEYGKEVTRIVNESSAVDKKLKDLSSYIAEAYAMVFYTSGRIPISSQASQFLEKFIKENSGDLLDGTLTVLCRSISNVLINKHRTLNEQLDSLVDGRVEKVNKANEEIAKYVSSLDEAKRKLDEYIAAAENVKSQLGFDVLSKAFENLSNEKKSEKKLYAFLIYLLGTITIIFPPILGYVIFKIQGEPKLSNLLFAIPGITVEIILLFYFRVALNIFNSVKAQNLQLGLRISLLNFVKNYIRFKQIEKIENLEKFESLIFSNLVTESDKIPPTIDGLDQVAKIFAQAKKMST